MRRFSTVFIAFGAFFALVGGIFGFVGLTMLARSKNEIETQTSVESLILGVIVLGVGAILLFLGIRSERWRPTAQELARRQDDMLYFRPVGLLLFVVVFVAVGSLGLWLDQFLPGLASGRRSPLAYILTLGFLALLSFRKVRNLVFYTRDAPDADEAKKAGSAGEPSAAADSVPDTASPEEKQKEKEKVSNQVSGTDSGVGIGP
jgi:hypothetical protein